MRVSPLAATALLIGVAIVAFVLIFFWFKALSTEQIEKFGSPIQDSCQKLAFEITQTGTAIAIDNKGAVAISGINLVITREGETVTRFLRSKDGVIDAGEEDFVVATIADLSGLIERLEVVPVILGEGSTTGQEKLHTCAEQRKSLI